MEINNKSFKSSLLNQMQQKSVASTPVIAKNDSFESQNTKTKKSINKKNIDWCNYSRCSTCYWIC